MKNLVVLLLLLLLVAAEATLWVRNPMEIPATFFPARAFGFQLFKEAGPSMEPAILPDHQVLVSTWSYWHANPQVGDIVAFVYPEDPSIADLKRVVATGGSSIEVREGVTYINGEAYPEPYLQSPPTERRFMRKLQVPPGGYFVMGDNRDPSEDSRNYGVIMRDHIIGRLWR
jgi:signal peptidase I